MCLVKAFRAFHKLQKSTKVIEGGRGGALLFSLEHHLPIYCSKKAANAKPRLCKKSPTVLLMQHLRYSRVLWNWPHCSLDLCLEEQREEEQRA